MDDFKTKLSDHISGSHLEDNEKKLWGIFLELAEPYENEAVYEAVSSGDENLRLLTDHLTDKIWSMRRGSDDWKGIVRDQGQLAGSL